MTSCLRHARSVTLWELLYIAAVAIKILSMKLANTLERKDTDNRSLQMLCTHNDLVRLCNQLYNLHNQRTHLVSCTSVHTTYLQPLRHSWHIWCLAKDLLILNQLVIQRILNYFNFSIIITRDFCFVHWYDNFCCCAFASWQIHLKVALNQP